MTMKTKLLLALLAITLGAIPATAQQAQTPAPDAGAAAHVEIPRITKAEFLSRMNESAAFFAPDWTVQLMPKDPSAATLYGDNVKSEVKSKRQRQHARFLTYVRSKIAAGDKGRNSAHGETLTMTPREFIAVASNAGEWNEQMVKWANGPVKSPGVISHSAQDAMRAIVAYAATPAGQAEDESEKAFAVEAGKALEAYNKFLAGTATAADREELRVFAEAIKP